MEQSVIEAKYCGEKYGENNKYNLLTSKEEY